jgi:hypothetical protein
LKHDGHCQEDSERDKEPRTMMDLTKEGLVRLARHFYPTGYPITTDDYSQELHPYQRTPEYARQQEAWERAMVWPEWKTLLQEMRRSFDGVGDCTQPWMSACRRCCVYLTRPLPNGARRVAAAVSVLAPLYVIYCTTTLVVNKHTPAHERRLFLELPEEAQPHAATLSALIERILGYQAFPLQFANIHVPEIRVYHMTSDSGATLLEALFDNRLDNLP